MGDGNSLINLGDLSKPATVFIEKVSAAVGALWEPRQIIRVAKAEADAAKIKALADLEVSELQQRGLQRLAYEAGKQQENIEDITADAASRVGADAKPEGMDADWIANFFEKAKLVSDKEMQSLWSRLLAGEATRPGSYSKRTVELIATLDKSDAELFTRLCSFTVIAGVPFPLIYGNTEKIYNGRGINFEALQHLEAIGLIKFDGIQEFVANGLPETVLITYFGLPFVLRLRTGAPSTMQLGQVLLTQAGKQLFPICGATLVPEFPAYLIEKFNALGYQVLGSPVPPASATPDTQAPQPP